MTKVAFLVNESKSDLGELREAIDELSKSELSEHQLQSDIVAFNSDHLKETLKRIKSEHFDRILVCGGDGTLHMIAKKAAELSPEERLPLGIIPMGTANDFANAAGFVGKDLKETISESIRAPARKVDVGSMNGHIFVNAATGGGVAKTTTDVPEPMKKAFGRFAYYLNGIAQARDIPTYHLKFQGPDWLIEENCFAFATGNGLTAGGGFRIAPNAKLDDGVLDLLIVPSQSVLALASLANTLLRDEPDLSQHDVRYLHTPFFTVEADQNIQVNLDGEPFQGNFFEFKAVPQFLDMVISDQVIL